MMASNQQAKKMEINMSKHSTSPRVQNVYCRRTIHHVVRNGFHYGMPAGMTDIDDEDTVVVVPGLSPEFVMVKQGTVEEIWPRCAELERRNAVFNRLMLLAA